MKRIFICSDARYPRGDAGANYVHYFALSLKENGWDVYVFGIGNNREEDYDKEAAAYSYRGIRYVNVALSERIRLPFVKYNFVFPWRLKGELYKFGICKDDYAVIYSAKLFLIRNVTSLFAKDRIAICWVEWMQSYQYKGGKLALGYYLYRRAFKSVGARVKKCFPISSVLDIQFCKQGARTLRLPIMADPYEYSYNSEKQMDEVIQFIYPGMKLTGYEDNHIAILEGFGLLESYELERVKIHITGTSMQSMQTMLEPKLFKKIKPVLIMHGFMDYKDLVELYKAMDYLLLVRKINAVTRANFPSKVPEVMSFGVIPICTDVGDYTKDYLNDENAIILHETGAEEFCTGIRKTLNMSENEYRNRRKAARQLVEKKFSYKNWGKSISRFLLEN